MANKKPLRPWNQLPAAPNAVTIFGAGVAGLTAAHELVERGFSVQVWEKQGDDRDPERGCDVGGMARTQWGSVDFPESQDLDRLAAARRSERPFAARRAYPILHLPQRFYLRGSGETTLVPDSITGEIAADFAEVVRLLGELARREPPGAGLVVYAEVSLRDPPAESDERAARAPFERLFGRLGVRWQEKERVYRVAGLERVEIVPVALAGLPYAAYESAEDVAVVVGFRPRQRWLPGEHGYRFFPSFYHHLFDTMKRTPLLDLADKSLLEQSQERAAGIRHPEPRQYVESGRTAFDNIHPTVSHVLAFSGGRRPSQLSRLAIGSFEELHEYVKILFGGQGKGFGLSPRDAARFSLKLMKFMTSCEARRREAEGSSWWDYLEAGDYSPEAQDLIKKWPEALVAMNALECDARTQGVAFIQLILDQIRPDTYRDGTLQGPTSEAWLEPWRRYLEAQGVEFLHGELRGFRTVERDGERLVWPDVTCFDPRYPCDEGGQPDLRPGYFVLAVSGPRARQIARQYAELRRAEPLAYAPSEHSDLAALERLGEVADLEKELGNARPEGEFRHFCGVQFYFAEDVYWIDGHVYYPDSPWQLTSISQARFWQDRMDWEHGYRGVLSAIVGTWDKPGVVEHREGRERRRRTAWECTPEELARDVWQQIQDAIHVRRTKEVGRFARRTPTLEKLPEPLYWHVDQQMELDGEQPRNLSPFFIARPGRFAARPGSLEAEGYAVEHGIVVAGYYTKTFTRLPTMESANESARHAVNAILRHVQRGQAPGASFHGGYCDVWCPEDREVDDLQFLKDLDAKLHERGIDHVLDLFEIDELAAHLLRGGARDPLDPLTLVARLRRLYREAAEKMK